MIFPISNFQFLILIATFGAVFLAVPIFAADTDVLQVDLVINKSGAVTLENMVVRLGFEDEILQEDEKGNYEFLVKGNILRGVLFRYKFFIDYEICTYIGECFSRDEASASFILPYSNKVRTIELQKEGKVIFSKVIKPLLCNKDNLCNNFENYLSCPSVCSPVGKDQACNSRHKDGICDLDCFFDTEPGGDCSGAYVVAQVFYGASESDLNFVCAADKKIYGSVTTANTQNFLFNGLAQVLDGWKRGLGALLAQVTSGGNCSVNAPWKVNYQGVNDKVGFTNQTSDGRFLCSQSKFYECGWESTIPEFASEAVQNQKVGNWSCDLQNKKWNAMPVIPPVATSDCSSITPWKTEYKGINGQLGFTNQPTDARFLCSQSKFYECGWESTIPDFAIEATQNQQVGSRYCDLETKIWKSGITSAPSTTLDCKWVNAGLTVTGAHNQTKIYTNGYPSTDNRYLCYSTKFFECDNDGISHGFSSNAITGQQVGNLVCDQKNNKWIPRDCTEKDWISAIAPLVCSSTGKQTKTWTKTGECSLGVQHPASESIGCIYIPPVPPQSPVPPLLPPVSPTHPVTEKCPSGCALPKWITASEGVFSEVDRNQECVEVGKKFSAKPNTVINIPESNDNISDLQSGDYFLGINLSSFGVKASFSPAGGEKYELFIGKIYDITQSGWDGRIKLKVDGIKSE